MNTFKKSIVAGVFYLLLLSFSPLLLTSCSDANEYEDTFTDNPSWVEGYTDSLKISHPESLASTRWVRGTGLKTNAYGEEVQGFVESLNFVSPLYEYKYNNTTGALEILKRVVNDKGAVTKQTIFQGVASDGKQTVLTIVHFGDSPIQTYLVKQ